MPSVLDWQQWFLFRVNKVVFFNRWSHKMVTSDTTVPEKHAEQSQQKMWPFMRGRALHCGRKPFAIRLPSVCHPFVIETPLERIISSIQKKKQCPVVRSFERKTILVIKAGIIYSERTLYSRPDRRARSKQTFQFSDSNGGHVCPFSKKSVFQIAVRKLAYFGKKGTNCGSWPFGINVRLMALPIIRPMLTKRIKHSQCWDRTCVVVSRTR